MRFDTGIVWFRRDLRINDNKALYAALNRCNRVYCVFVFDIEILDYLPRQDRRVEFIRESLIHLDEDLRTLSRKPDSGLIVRHGIGHQEIVQLASDLKAEAVFAAHDYEPLAIARDLKVKHSLAQMGIAFETYKDHVIFENREILTTTGTPYGVFTPYKNAWLAQLDERTLRSVDAEDLPKNLVERPKSMQQKVMTLAALGFESTNFSQLQIPTGARGAQVLFTNFLSRIDRYDETRNFPSIKGPSYLGVHLRFGTISIRSLVLAAWQRIQMGSLGATVWLSELIWRDFYFQILANTPHVAKGSYKPSYDAIQWETGEEAQDLFKIWCQGLTGYPLVDAAMAQLNQTGYMHNRLRMVSASFLVKHLGIDWRWGERYFAEKLNDFDLSANNGGWQWVSSSGCDAQPYFRIFNPINQSEKFDPDGKFIRRYLPQLSQLSNKLIHAPWKATASQLSDAKVSLGRNYPTAVVSHELARAQTLDRYAVVKKNA